MSAKTRHVVAKPIFFGVSNTKLRLTLRPTPFEDVEELKAGFLFAQWAAGKWEISWGISQRTCNVWWTFNIKHINLTGLEQLTCWKLGPKDGKDDSYSRPMGQTFSTIQVEDRYGMVSVLRTPSWRLRQKLTFTVLIFFFRWSWCTITFSKCCGFLCCINSSFCKLHTAQATLTHTCILICIYIYIYVCT